MRTVDALRELGEVTAGQWGMVTAAQAARLGISRLVLARLAEAGHLHRLTHGVYRGAGVPTAPFDDLRAAWLGAEPARLAETRLADGPEGVVVAGASAASLHDIGDLRSDRHDFVSRRRRQSRRPEIRYRQRTLDPVDVTIVAGLPVMTVERTIADLIDDVGDLSLSADALRDAARRDALDEGRLTRLLNPLATRTGLAVGDGAALLAHLKAAAGIDAAAVAGRLAADPEVGPLVAAGVLQRMDKPSLVRLAAQPALERAVRTVSEQASRRVAAAVQPTFDAAAATIGRNFQEPWTRSPGTDRVAELISRILSDRLLTPDFLGQVTAALGQSARRDADGEREAAAPARAEHSGDRR